MNPSFNLLREPWLPCVDLSGRPVKHSLRSVLAHAHELKELSDPCPLVPAALLRLLLAVLYRALGNPTRESWRCLWQAGRFDMALLDAYLSRWENRFDLLDERHPFYQTAGLELKYLKPLAKMVFTDADTFSSPLFSHTSYFGDDLRYALDEAARCLVTFQAFTPNAGIMENGPSKNSPLANVYLVLMRGETIFETLLLNYVEVTDSQIPDSGCDSAVWEQDDASLTAESVVARGVADYLTWPSRVLRLITSGELASDAGLCSLYVGQGSKIEGDVHDPWLGYSWVEGRGGGAIEAKPWQFRPERAAWRDCEVIFASLLDDKAYIAPAAFEWLAGFVTDGLLPRSAQKRLELVGYRKKEASQPTIGFWRADRLPLPLAYLNDPDLVAQVRKAFLMAREGATALRQGAWMQAFQLLPLLPKDSKGKEVNKLIDSWGGERDYWKELEVPFGELLVKIPEDKDGATLMEWAVLVKRTTRGVFDRLARELGESGKALQAAVKGKEALNRRLYSVPSKKGETQPTILSTYLQTPKEEVHG